MSDLTKYKRPSSYHCTFFSHPLTPLSNHYLISHLNPRLNRISKCHTQSLNLLQRWQLSQGQAPVWGQTPLYYSHSEEPKLSSLVGGRVLFQWCSSELKTPEERPFRCQRTYLTRLTWKESSKTLSRGSALYTTLSTTLVWKVRAMIFRNFHRLCGMILLGSISQQSIIA